MVLISILRQKEKALQAAWVRYQSLPKFENFVEFALLLNSFTDFLLGKSFTGLLNASRQLEQQALTLFGDENSHPVSPEVMEDMGRRLARLGELLCHYSDVGETQRERRESTSDPQELAVGSSDSLVRLVGEAGEHWNELVSQLGYFGITVQRGGWEVPELDEVDDGVFLVDLANLPVVIWLGALSLLRERRPLTKIICLGVPADFVALGCALRSGADCCIPFGTPLQRVISHVLERNGNVEQEPYRVLVVEDSRTAARMICRSLEENGVVTRVLDNPASSLDAIRQFQPDLILMDMYMPGCTGVEAARVIRQYDEFLSIPIVYLSGETDIRLQIDALRLGGDHFLTKPFNPVVMNAVIKSKIDRYRALRRSMFNDSLTDLLNHTSSKQALRAAMEESTRLGASMAVVMLDIDHFKGVNDSYGHPMGDQVIRTLAWLLRQRLRRRDIVGRYGGEEFVLGLLDVDADEAKEIIDRIREDFSRISFAVPEGVFRVTFSAGIAAAFCADPRQLDLEEILEVADEALYEAKRTGRNRVVAVNPPYTPPLGIGAQGLF